MEHGDGVKQLLGGCSIANILSALLEGLNPQTIPQDGDAPQGPYKPPINPQIRDIKTGTAGKTGLISCTLCRNFQESLPFISLQAHPEQIHHMKPPVS